MKVSDLAGELQAYKQDAEVRFLRDSASLSTGASIVEIILDEATNTVFLIGPMPDTPAPVSVS